MSTRQLKRKRLGIDRFIYELEGLFLNSEYLRNRFYFSWLNLEEKDKAGFRSEVSSLIREHIINREFREAIAKDIIKQEGEGVSIEVNETFKYLKKRVYKNKAREMLIDLVSKEE